MSFFDSRTGNLVLAFLFGSFLASSFIFANPKGLRIHDTTTTVLDTSDQPMDDSDNRIADLEAEVENLRHADSTAREGIAKAISHANELANNLEQSNAKLSQSAGELAALAERASELRLQNVAAERELDEVREETAKQFGAVSQAIQDIDRRIGKVEHHIASNPPGFGTRVEIKEMYVEIKRELAYIQRAIAQLDQAVVCLSNGQRPVIFPKKRE